MNILCRALIWNACFLELSEEGVVDADVAIEQLEQMSNILQQVSAEEREAFVAECARESARLRTEGGARDARVAEVIANLPESLGVK
jgi:Asp-tRNA(Asn)/Glu-tRNA(Gln) amidotransferase C subunit